MQEEIVRANWRDRVAVLFDKAEHVYLRILRAVILIIATLMIGYAAWLAASSLYKISRSPDSVTEEVAEVNADEITNAAMPEKRSLPSAGGQPMASPEQRNFYADLVNRYYDLFRTRFEPHRQADDKKLTRDEFDDSFVASQARLEAVAKGELDYQADKADLNRLFAVMSEAAEKPTTQQRLRTYHSAVKIRVPNQVQRTRTEYRSGWDTYSTNCSDWYESPVGCAVRRPVQVPYTETVFSMEFPKGTQSHTQIFRAFQDRYLQLLDEKRTNNARKASKERDTITIGKIEGGLSLMTALQIAAAFLGLMFFFLLIAIERHQRRMSQMLESK